MSLAAKNGRRGGLARARNLTPERRQEIARQGSIGRLDRRLFGMAQREFSKRVVERIRQEDADLSWWISFTVKAPLHIAPTLIDLLSDRAMAVVERAIDQVAAEWRVEKEGGHE